MVAVMTAMMAHVTPTTVSDPSVGGEGERKKAPIVRALLELVR